RVELAGLGVVPRLHELVAHLHREHGVVHHHARHAGDRAGDDVLEARVRGARHRHAVAFAAQAGGEPDDVGGDRPLLGLVGYELGCGHISPSQQIRGSGSPTNWSIALRPPNAVLTSTIPGGSVLTSPIAVARAQPSTPRSASSAAPAASAATNATNTPSL